MHAHTPMKLIATLETNDVLLQDPSLGFILFTRVRFRSWELLFISLYLSLRLLPTWQSCFHIKKSMFWAWGYTFYMKGKLTGKTSGQVVCQCTWGLQDCCKSQPACVLWNNCLLVQKETIARASCHQTCIGCSMVAFSQEVWHLMLGIHRDHVIFNAFRLKKLLQISHTYLDSQVNVKYLKFFLKCCHAELP